jgi:hypothetical protein
MDNPPADQGEHHQDDQSPILLASIVVEVLAEVLARREGQGPVRILEATQPDRSIHSME